MEAGAGWFQDRLPLPLPPDPAWTRKLVAVKIERGSVPAATAESMPAGDVGHVIGSLADEPDVTVTVSGSDPAAGEVMIAVSGGHYFLGLLSPAGEVHQYAATGNEQPGAGTMFIIHGERTEIESRYVVDAGPAVAAVQEWLAVGRETASPGHWVKM